jgi:hypothetical protein
VRTHTKSPRPKLRDGQLFFPQNQVLGLDRTSYSPRVQRKIVHAGVNSASYQQASRDLAELSGLTVPPKPVERLTKRIGQERVDQRDAAVAAFQERPLMEQDTVAVPGRPCPPVAMASVDGGRLQVRSTATATATAATRRSSHWRESKVAVLETYQSEVSPTDPDPDVPGCFLDLAAATRLVRGLGHALPVGLELEGERPTPTRDEPATTGRDRKARPGRPQRLVRSVLASRGCAETFGPMMHQAAWERNFFGAARRAFLGDGLPVNWTIQQRHFPSFEAILDFVHALSYLFAAAFAGRERAEGAAVYTRWIQAVWSGQVESILPELEAHSAALGMPPPECAASDPRQLVFEALRYLRNNTDRMRYDEYRRRGLPIMTCAVESMIKQINRRVKGSEKFWSEPGAEAILQLRADYLSETVPMERFWNQREDDASGQRRYRQAA